MRLVDILLYYHVLEVYMLTRSVTVFYSIYFFTLFFKPIHYQGKWDLIKQKFPLQPAFRTSQEQIYFISWILKIYVNIYIFLLINTIHRANIQQPGNFLNKIFDREEYSWIIFKYLYVGNFFFLILFIYYSICLSFIYHCCRIQIR